MAMDCHFREHIFASESMERDAADACRTAAPATGGRAEIDTRPPFRSVREAVALFGEKVLAGEIYANRLEEMRTAAKLPSGSPSTSPQSRIRALTAELEQTRQTLSKTLEENTILSQRIKTLKDELERARREIQKLRKKEHEPMSSHRIEDPEIEELKFVEQRPTVNNIASYNADDRHKKEEEIVEELEKRRLVRFASPPSLTRVMVNREKDEEKEKKVLERPPSVKKEREKKVLESSPSGKKMKNKMKSSFPFMGWFV